MDRKVFISILGTSFYGRCQYQKDNFKSIENRFIQTATLELLNAENWSENDVVQIYLTSEAKTNNWNIAKRKLKTDTEEVEYKGLKQCLEEMNLACQIKPIDIVNGKDEKEIWLIFETIYNNLEDNDELYIDLTHSFRYLPMLLLVLINYAKFLKNVTVRHISYGNYEARNGNVAPIVDLMPIIALQEWTSAAHEIIKFGDVVQLKKLTDRNVKPILAVTEGANESAKTLKQLFNKSEGNLNTLCEEIKTNRGLKVIEGKSAKNVIEILSKLQNDLIAPLNPILENIKKSVEIIHNAENDVQNMIKSVQWCIDKNLIQEGFTLLQEGIISQFIADDFNNEKKRNFVSGYLSQFKGGKFESTRFNLMITEIIELENLLTSNQKIADWANLFSQISQIRNDINHAGIRPNPIKGSDFKVKLKKLLEEYNLINQYESD